ncbi:MAG: type IV-A pilus assembly ATPase PilB, partial [Vibrio ordalii]
MLTNLPAILRQAQILSPTQEHAVIEHIKASGASVPDALLALDFFHPDDLTEQLSTLF